MKTRKLLVAIGLWLPLIVYGQTISPLWVEDAYRELHYPAEQWYTGFVHDRLNPGANIANALKVLERNAQNQLAESIIVHIEGGSRLENTSRQRQSSGRSSEVITTEYLQVVKTATSATTVKTEIKSYHDSSTGTLYAFAAVKRADLANFYRKQINVDLSKVETALGVSEQLVAAGKKMSARRKCEEAKSILDNTDSCCALLIAVDTDSNESALQIERSQGLQRMVEQLLIDLEQSTFVYVDCKYESKGYKNDAFGHDPGIFCDMITQALSENECSVTDNREEADYELTLITSTMQRSDGSGQYGIISYYANVRGNLYNRLTRKKTVDFSIYNDPDVYAAGKTPEIAATKAFKLPALSKKVLEKILPKIKN
jgi:hypothetical protein